MAHSFQEARVRLVGVVHGAVARVAQHLCTAHRTPHCTHGRRRGASRVGAWPKACSTRAAGDIRQGCGATPPGGCDSTVVLTNRTRTLCRMPLSGQLGPRKPPTAAKRESSLPQSTLASVAGLTLPTIPGRAGAEREDQRFVWLLIMAACGGVVWPACCATGMCLHSRPRASEAACFWHRRAPHRQWCRWGRPSETSRPQGRHS
jgi:hypothetical protein